MKTVVCPPISGTAAVPRETVICPKLLVALVYIRLFQASPALFMDIIFRDYQAIDYLSWRALWLDYTEPTAAHLTEDLHQHTFARVRDGEDALHGVIAWTDRPVGFAHYYFHPSSYSIHNICTLEDIYVCATARCQGVARALIGLVAARAAAARAPVLNWKTRETNASAQSLYDSLAVRTGFIAYQMALPLR